MNLDRFKFRAIITVWYDDCDGNEKTMDLYIKNVDAISNGSVGFDIDQLDNAISEVGIVDDIEIDRIHEHCYDNNGCRSDDYFVMDGIIEQCTGLKDKNGNLIYEGDIVIGRKEIVVCEMMEYKDVVEYKDGEYFPFNWIGVYKPEKFEIIGNIHEQKD